MGHKLGPEARRGVALTEAQYVELHERIARTLSERTLHALAERLGMGFSDHTHTRDRVAADVSFGRWARDIERVEGPTLHVALAKAIALAIDRRLGAIASARRELDDLMDRVTVDSLGMMLERLILRAAMPTTPGALAPSDTEKAGESPHD